ncbi:ParA family protein [Enterobacter bugandensis]|uniref:ParA family protein n=2 Tax=Enterobacter TaxID=547 RepID=A0ABU6E848_9ENTR|nr:MULTISPECIES: ParA family partition ATPase [Gammaproteobacteria]EKU2876644.1 ParA family protein [Enterobacter cloacae]MCM7564605.1 ParA family protein [Enterobacter hormaechei]HCM9646019.1 ParA family protein [Enterobacter hormaechei subsp. xiangfangensis]EKX4052729.1 ParA family protein [Enterobacter cloacae]KFA85089.1 chromosome partitioning protein ParA [Enterobacter sp. EGD-HP1]
MAKIIAILNGKGGVGKTTSTINIATAIQRKGFSVAVVDTDPQGSISNWFDEEKCAFDLTEAASEKEVYQVRKSLKSYDYVIIDGAAAISAISSAAVMVSDLVVIPVTPSPLDFAACGAILAVIEARQDLQPVEARFLITKKIPHSKMLAVLKDSIEDTGVPAFRTSISQRQAYVKVMLDGSTVFDTDDGAAKGEIDVLTNEILEITA